MNGSVLATTMMGLLLGSIALSDHVRSRPGWWVPFIIAAAEFAVAGLVWR